MRILVIGRSGQVAHALAAAAGAGDEVILAGRPEVDVVRADTLRSAIEAHRPEVVVNAAAYTAVDKAESEPGAAFAANAEGAGAVAEAAAAAGLPILHLSTDYVFDGSKPGPYAETDPTSPLGVYGASKLEGERRVAAATPRHVIVRTSWVVSPFGANFVKTMLRLARERDELRVVADQHGAPTYAPDLAHALIAAARQVASAPAGDSRFGLYHLANAGTATWADVAEATLRASARFGGRAVSVRRISTAEYPTPARRPLNSRLLCDRFTASFGIAMPAWEDAIERCVAALHDAG